MAEAPPQNPGLLNWLLIISLGVIWGGAFMSVRLSLNGFGPWSVAAGRTFIGALALATLGAIMGQGVWTIPSKKAFGFAVILGIGATAIPFALLSWGQQFVPSAFAGIAMGAVPLLTLPLVYLFSPEEGIGPRRIVGMVMGFIGLVLLVGPGATTATGSVNESLGRMACLGATCCYACGSIVTRRAPRMPPIAFASVSMITAAVVLTPIALVTEGVPDALPLTPTMALLYAALFPTALAAIIRVWVITSAGSLFMSLTSYQVPVWSAIFGVTLMGEQLPNQLFIALAIILAGIGLSQSRSWGAVFRRSKPRS